jgi:outer membrane immunogenic protein
MRSRHFGNAISVEFDYASEMCVCDVDPAWSKEMKKLLIAVGGIAAMVTSVSAADLDARLSTKAPSIPVTYKWSGFYMGVNAGSGSARQCWDLVRADVAFALPRDMGCQNARGATVGGQVGYRWQSGRWVFGLEGQGNWADFAGSNSSLAFADETNNSKVRAFGLITGQVGYAWSNLLFYVKGGAAAANDKYDVFRASTGSLIVGASKTRWGGAVGTGLEFAFAPNWSLGVEYDHLFLGSSDVTLTGQFVDVARIQQNADIALARLNYRFGGSGLTGR